MDNRHLTTKETGFQTRKRRTGQWVTVAGATILTMAAGGSVSADEVVAQPNPQAGPVVLAEPITESSIANDTPTGNAATNLVEAAAPQADSQMAFDASANQVTGSVDVTIDHSTLQNAAKEAEQVGVEVKQDPTELAPTTSTAEDTNKAVESIVAKENSKADEIKGVAKNYSEERDTWSKQKESVVTSNSELDKAHLSAVDKYNNFVKGLDEDTAKIVAQHKDALIEIAEKEGMTEAKTVEQFQEYIKKLSEIENKNRAAIDKYLTDKKAYDDNKLQISEVEARNHSNSAQVEAENNASSQSVSEENRVKSLAVENFNKSVTDTTNAHNLSLSTAIAEIQKQNEEGRASVAAYNKAQEEKAAIENARRQAEYEKNKGAASAAAAEVEAKNKEINERNKKTMESVGLTWTGDWTKDKATVDNYNANRGSNSSSSNVNTTEFNKAVAKTVSKLPDSGNGYTPSGTSSFLPPVTLSNGARVVGGGQLTQDGAKIYFDKEVDQSKIIKDVNWTTQIPEGPSILPLTAGSIWGNVYNYDSGGTTQKYIIKTNTWYKIPNLITTMDGEIHDGYVRYQSDVSGLHPAYDGSEVAFWNANGALNAVDGGSVGNVNQKSDALRLQISLDKPDNDDKSIIWLSLMSDLDGGQYLDGAYGKLLGVGGGMSSSKGTASDEDLGFTYGIGMNSNALDGYKSSPDGTLLFISEGIYNNSLRNTPGGNASAVARADFGSEAKLTIEFERVKEKPEISIDKPMDPPGGVPGVPDEVKPDIKTWTDIPTPSGSFEPPKPQTFTPIEWNKKPFTPEEVPTKQVEPKLNLEKLIAPHDPEFKEIPNEPARPSVNYSLTALKENTPAIKEARNADGVNIDGESVAKGSTNHFILAPKKLPAGRVMTTSVVYSDYIQEGLELNLADMIKVNKNWDVDFNKDTRLLTFTGNSSELEAANKNRMSDYTLSPVTVIYRPMNDAATYTNTFRLDVNNGATGNVFVEYYVEGSNVLLGKAKDTVNEPVGSSYDTTDLIQTTITKDGKTYERVVSHVEGEEQGKVTEGDKVVKYFYKEVPSKQPGIGDVIVTYEDEDGNIIKQEVTDTKDGKVDDPYDTTDNKPSTIESNGKVYELVPSKTRGNENGKVTEGVTTVTYVYKQVTPDKPKGDGYTSYSNKVTIHTPGGKNNPNNPNNPNGPGNEKIQPVKNNKDKDGNIINNKTLLQKAVNHYVAEWDLDQYLNDKSSKVDIAKGFMHIDNPQDDALKGLVEQFKSLTAKGEAVEGLNFYEAHSDKLSELPQSVQNRLKASGIDVSDFGLFYIWDAADPQAFYDKYVKTGTDIFFNLPMEVKEGYKGDYTNKTYQIDFGNGYEGNVVKNNVPDLVPSKDVVVDGTSVDGKVIAFGQEFQYLLKGAKLPGNRGEAIWEYNYIDDYDQAGDEFLETYAAKSTTPTKLIKQITLAGKVLEAGSVIPVGTDLTEFTTMTHDKENGIITIAFKEDFLAAIDNDSEFGADVSIDMKRIAYGTFENKYTNRINGVDYISNTVKTSTPTPETPATPETPTPANPVAPVDPSQPVLPNTGTESNVVMAAFGALTGLFGLGLARKRTED